MEVGIYNNAHNLMQRIESDKLKIDELIYLKNCYSDSDMFSCFIGKSDSAPHYAEINGSLWLSLINTSIEWYTKRMNGLKEEFEKL